MSLKSIKEFFTFNTGNRVTKDHVRLEVFVDSLKSRNKTPITLNVKKEMLLKDLRKEIALGKRIDKDELILLINFRIWDDDARINEVVDGMGVFNGGYIVYAVIITDADDEKIDFNLENFLKEKYSYSEVAEQEFIFVDESINKSKEDVTIVDLPVECPLCQKSKPKSQVVALEYCRHVFCKDCLYSLISKYIGESVKCPEQNCNRTLIDHEFQQIVGADGYDKWQNIIERKSAGEPSFIFPKIGWVCDSCTFLNKPYIKFCDTCNENRPVDYKIPRIYVPSQEEELIKKGDDEEMKTIETLKLMQEADKSQRLEELKSLSRQSVAFTNETTECPICVMEYGPKEAIILHSCMHTICKDCLRNYLLNVEDAQVKCPTEGCMGLVEDREISAILTNEEYHKYELLNLRMAEAKEKFSFHCKEVNCTAWVVHDGIVSSFHCPICNKKNCIKCDAIHENLTCQEYQMKKLSETPDLSQTENEKYIQSLITSGVAMKCPGCQMIVEKNKGCDGVLCRGCGMMICWATKGPRWGPKGKGDRSGGCGCRFMWGRRCHPNCHYCH